MQIKESELIIKPDGSIYHLGLVPEDIRGTIITVGDPARVSMISKHFDQILYQKSYREFVTHCGHIGEKWFTIIATGIGPDNIDIVLNELDALVNIDFQSRTIKHDLTSLDIIRIGTSGAIYDGIATDSVVISAGAVGLDNLMHFYLNFNNRISDELLTWDIPWPVKPYFEWSDNQLLKKFEKLGTPGITLTNVGFYGPQTRRLRLEPFNSDFISLLQNKEIEEYHFTNMEMETSAIYGLAKLLGHRALSINSILANRTVGTFSADPKKAMEKLIIDSLEILSSPQS